LYKRNMSPTQRSLKYLREQGLKPWVVEVWNPWARIRQDLYGCIDILALGNQKTYAIQCTSTGVSSRIKKIQESPYFQDMKDSGWEIWVMGWSKGTNGRYKVRIEIL
jgi:hypothetical protein